MALPQSSEPLAVDPATALQTFNAAWDMWQRVGKHIGTLRKKVKDSDVCIVVFGPGGVGKTTLGKFLAEDFDPTAKPEAYQESIDTETYRLQFDPTKKIIVAPGQEHRINRYKARLLKEMTDAKTAILCNVVSFGYHSLSSEKKQNLVVAEYLANQCQRELEIVTELADFLYQTEMPLKMITMVTKQDLWWRKQDEVRAHYEHGEYAEQIERIRSAKGSQHFMHEYVYTSLFLHNLIAPSGQVIGLTTEGYDDTVRFDSQRKAFEVMEKFVGTQNSGVL